MAAATALAPRRADALGAVLARAVVNRGVVRGPVLQRLDDDDVAEIRANKKTKKEFEDARDRFNAQFASGKPLARLPGAETWSYLVEHASSLANLKQRVEAEITKGQHYFASLSTPKPEPEPKPVVSTPVVSTPVPSLVGVGVGVGSSSSSTATVTAPTKKKKPKMVSAQHLLASGPAYVQQVVPVTVALTNPEVKELIKTKPFGATRVVGPPQLSDDTVYYDLTITLPVDNLTGIPRQRRHVLEIHHHPVPISQNYLHIKMKAGGSPSNQVLPGNWLIDRAQLNAGVAEWNAAGGAQSMQAF